MPTEINPEALFQKLPFVQQLLDGMIERLLYVTPPQLVKSVMLMYPLFVSVPRFKKLVPIIVEPPLLVNVPVDELVISENNIVISLVHVPRFIRLVSVNVLLLVMLNPLLFTVLVAVIVAPFCTTPLFERSVMLVAPFPLVVNVPDSNVKFETVKSPALVTDPVDEMVIERGVASSISVPPALIVKLFEIFRTTKSISRITAVFMVTS